MIDQKSPLRLDGIPVRTPLDRKSCRLCLLVHMPDRQSTEKLFDEFAYFSEFPTSSLGCNSLTSGRARPACGTWSQVFQVGFCGNLPGPGALRGAGPMAQGPPGPCWPCRLARSVCRWLGAPVHLVTVLAHASASDPGQHQHRRPVDSSPLSLPLPTHTLPPPSLPLPRPKGGLAIPAA